MRDGGAGREEFDVCDMALAFFVGLGVPGLGKVGGGLRLGHDCVMGLGPGPAGLRLRAAGLRWGTTAWWRIGEETAPGFFPKPLLPDSGSGLSFGFNGCR